MRNKGPLATMRLWDVVRRPFLLESGARGSTQCRGPVGCRAHKGSAGLLLLSLGHEPLRSFFTVFFFGRRWRSCEMSSSFSAQRSAAGSRPAGQSREHLPAPNTCFARGHASRSFERDLSAKCVSCQKRMLLGLCLSWFAMQTSQLSLVLAAD